MAIVLMAALFSCRREIPLFSGNNAMLELRSDTVYFDTVFTQSGGNYPMSVTKQLVIVNPYDEKVRTDIRLGAGEQSFFRLNADGIPGKIIEGLEILPRDSVFVFVELSLPPNGDPQSRPLIIRDSIEFLTHGARQYVHLAAWGQDAHYFLRDTLCNVVWDDVSKPYVVAGYVYVPEGCTFTIQKGVKVHTSARSWIYVEGQLRVNGTADEPVEFQADRLEPAYEEIPGQWGGIWLAWPSTNNVIRHALIKNGTVGIYMDSSSSNGNPNALVYNTMVRNMSFDGMAGKGSTVYAENSVFANCGRFSFLAQQGGNYDLRHCTFATYGGSFSRRDPGLAVLNIERDELLRPIASFDLNFSLQNSIVDGVLEEEIGWDLDPSKLGTFYFGHNLLRSKRNELAESSLKNVLNQPARFKNVQAYDFQIDSASSAIDIGAVLSPPIQSDFEGKARDSKPDAGAFERQ